MLLSCSGRFLGFRKLSNQMFAMWLWRRRSSKHHVRSVLFLFQMFSFVTRCHQVSSPQTHLMWISPQTSSCLLRCSPEDGQCSCLQNMIGRRCSDPAPGFFLPSLDYFLYEAELAAPLPGGSRSSTDASSSYSSLVIATNNVHFILCIGLGLGLGLGMYFCVFCIW